MFKPGCVLQVLELFPSSEAATDFEHALFGIFVEPERNNYH